MRWNRATTSTIGAVEIELSGTTEPGVFGDAQYNVAHMVFCRFPIAPGHAVVPAQVLETFEAGRLNGMIRVAERTRVGLGGGWDLRVDARSFGHGLSLMLR